MNLPWLPRRPGGKGMEGSKLLLILQLWLHCSIIHTCKGPCLYFSVGNSIKGIKLSARPTTSTVVVQDIGRVVAIAVDVEDNFIYWSDFNVGTIKRMSLLTNKRENVTESVGRVEGIAIDWIDKDVFWTDTTNKRIEMAKVDGSDRKILFDRDIDEPRGIAVDVVNGYIFWTDWGSNPKIERASLDGKGRVTIVEASSSSPLKWVNGVIVDYADPESVIYWVDAGLGVVGRADLDGRNRKLSENITNSFLFAIALHNGTFYLSDNRAKTIRLVDKKSLKYLGKLDLPFAEIHGITVLDESRQPLNLVTVSITLEMKMEEWEEEKFKQAVVKGTRDYCYEDTCRYNSRNTTIARKLCSTLTNDSNAGSVHIRVAKQPGEFSLFNQTKVVFSIILQTQANSTRSVVKNSTLDYIVKESGHYISKHLGGYKVVYVNSRPPSSEKFCNDTNNKDNNNKKDTKDMSTKKGNNVSTVVGIIVGGITLLVILVIAGGLIWQFRCESRGRGNHGAQVRDNIGDEIEPGQQYEEITDVAKTRNDYTIVLRPNHPGNDRIYHNKFNKDERNKGNSGKKSNINHIDKKKNGQWFSGANRNANEKEKYVSTPSLSTDIKRGAEENDDDDDCGKCGLDKPVQCTDDIGSKGL